MAASKACLVVAFLVWNPRISVNGLSASPSSRRDFVSGSVSAGILLSSQPTLGVSAASIAASTPSPLLVDKGLVQLPPMGLGAWAWGDALFWGYRPSEDGELRKVFDFALSQGTGCLFDTAELYGLGRSEQLIGDFSKGSANLQDKEAASLAKSPRVSVATKFAPLPWRTTRESVVKAAKASAGRLGVDSIDLYQIHFPNVYANEAYWDGLGDAYEQGLVKAVGVSNYGSAALRACHAKLAKRGIPLATNQIQLSLLYRCPLENGLIETCNELGVKVIAYSPLALGFLTGKYGSDKPFPSGPRANIAKTLFAAPTSSGGGGGSGSGGSAAFDHLLSAMQEVSRAHGDAPLCQVALNWCIAKGAVPIPGARTLTQAKQNLGALAWSLTPDQVSALDSAAAPLPPLVPPEQSQFPKADKDTGLIMFDS